MIIYFAYPIDALEDDDAARLASVVAAARAVLLQHYPTAVIYEPKNAWQMGEEASPSSCVQMTNSFALGLSDVMLALLPTWASSIGVPLEVQEASRQGIPVALVRSKPSWALAHMEGVFQFQEANAAIEGLEQVAEKRRRVHPSIVPFPMDEVFPLPHGTVDRILGRGVLRVKRESSATTPTRAYPDDAGFDLYYHGEEQIIVKPGTCVDVPSGVAVEWPTGAWGLLVGRSSSFRNRGLLVNPAVIDPGFRGALFAIVRNISPSPVAIFPNERIAQIVPIPLVPDVSILEVDKLSDHPRGENGFGSSGK